VAQKEPDTMNTETTLLSVPEMTCGSCVHHVGEALQAVDGVLDVEVRLRNGEVSVRHDADEAPVRALLSALAEAGYEATVVPAVRPSLEQALHPKV
jgi:copper chaperone